MYPAFQTPFFPSFPSSFTTSTRSLSRRSCLVKPCNYPISPPLISCIIYSENLPTTTTPHPQSRPDLHIPAHIQEDVVNLAKEWASPADGLAAILASNHSSISYLMSLVDQVVRPENTKTAAHLFQTLHQTHSTPTFLNPIDRLLLNLAVIMSKYVPIFVIPAVRLRIMQFASPFIAILHATRFDRSVQRNVNLLGEAVLGQTQASKIVHNTLTLMQNPAITYVSVKLSSIVPQINHWDFDTSLHRAVSALHPLFRKAALSTPQVLVNLDMEEYHDLHLTVAAFKQILSDPQFQDLDAGIVLQTYLPDSFPVLQDLVLWAHQRPGIGQIKIRLVKGANLPMERVDAALHGWSQAPYLYKHETDANYLRCLSWVLTPSRTARVRIGIATHNIFTLAFAKTLAVNRGVEHRIGIEMLQGMAPNLLSKLNDREDRILVYTPMCAVQDFDVAIAYLFRRFEETTKEENFLRSLPHMARDSQAFRDEEARFRHAFQNMNIVSSNARRNLIRPSHKSYASLNTLQGDVQFQNEPDTDPSLPQNRLWAKSVLSLPPVTCNLEPEMLYSQDQVEGVVDRARTAVSKWSNEKTTRDRLNIFISIADELARRRGDLINAMVSEGRKTFAEADSEVSEAIDFAVYYGHRGQELPQTFNQLGVICVVSPWNFPVAIPCGGALAALAAGNAVIIRPSRETPICAHLVAEILWNAGVPVDVLQFALSKSASISKKLITMCDGVILTGSLETARLFLSWKNDMKLFAETSGKNSIIVSHAADLDLAVQSLVQSAFSNSGQKCSAASIGICLKNVYTSKRFIGQLKDAVESINVGSAENLDTTMGPLIRKPSGKLLRALTSLDEGESWIVKPRCLDYSGEGRLWSPGVKLGVRAGSWFHTTEVFGPVLGIMQAKDIGDAILMQNSTAYGLTGGLHTLDSAEIDVWLQNVNVGNAYINRSITGAIVRRQSFGGWKKSVIGPGAKAGGPNYVRQFGTIDENNNVQRDKKWLERSILSDDYHWNAYFSLHSDPSLLFCESNELRYCPFPSIAIRISMDANVWEVRRVKHAVMICGIKDVVWSEGESAEEFVSNLRYREVSRIRIVGSLEESVLEAAVNADIHICDDPVVSDGRTELMHYLLEQSISKTLHRFGNVSV